MDWLQKRNSCLIITSKSPYSQMKTTLDNSGQLILDPPVDIDQLSKLLSSYSNNQYNWIVGVGGGRIMDISKYAASKLKAKLCLIPTALSTTAWLNMAIALRKSGMLHFSGQKHADTALIDPMLIKHSPAHLSLGGVADVLCAVTAMTDWKLGHEKIGEKYSEDAYSAYKTLIEKTIQEQSKLKPFDEKAIVNEVGIFLDSLALCGAAMSGRPLEGSEHFLYYCIDEKSQNPIIHGGMIALAILISLRLQGDQAMLKPEVMKQFFDDIGILYRPTNIKLSFELLSQALAEMPEFVKIRKLPYSIWNFEGIYEKENSIDKILQWVVEF